MGISISSSMPTEEDIKKYLPEFLNQNYPGKTEFSQDDSKIIGKEYLPWLISKLSSAQMVSHNAPVKRELKGNSIIQIIEDYVSIDIETTGLDPSYDEIIEIGAVKCHDGIVCDKFQSLVKPQNEIDEYISELTGITNDMLSTAPPIISVLPKFLEFISDNILLGHNVNFDINFLYDNCTNLALPPISNDFIDTMRVSRKLFKDFANHKLATLINNFCIDCSNAHRAIADCTATMQCYEYMKKHIADNHIDISLLCAYSHHQIKACEISATTSSFDKDSPLFGKLCVFTGALEKMLRKDAMQLVVNSGGQCGDNVTSKTNYLILGNNDYCKTIKDGKSTKQKKAEVYKLKGFDIEIISENVFYDMIGDCENA